MTTRALIHAEIENLREEDLGELYQVIRRFAETKAPPARKPGALSRLRQIKIRAPKTSRRTWICISTEKNRLPVNKTFVDTLFVVALINERDQYHEPAEKLAERYDGQPLLITDAVLLEIGNALARAYRREAVDVIETFLSSEDVEIVYLTPTLFDCAFQLYKTHRDKEWGLIDCISFVVMRDAGVSAALTFDQHFVQAGFQALLRDRPGP